MDLERESCVAASQCKRGRCKFVLGLKLQCAAASRRRASPPASSRRGTAAAAASPAMPPFGSSAKKVHFCTKFARRRRRQARCGRPSRRVRSLATRKKNGRARSHSLLHSSRAEMAAARLHLRICKMHREAAAYCQTRPPRSVLGRVGKGRLAGAARGSIMAAAALVLYIQNKTERGMKMHLRKCQFFFLISSSETR